MVAKSGYVVVAWVSLAAMFQIMKACAAFLNDEELGGDATPSKICGLLAAEDIYFILAYY